MSDLARLMCTVHHQPQQGRVSDIMCVVVWIDRWKEIKSHMEVQRIGMQIPQIFTRFWPCRQRHAIMTAFSTNQEGGPFDRQKSNAGRADMGIAYRSTK